MSYADFIVGKSQRASLDGFEPVWMPDFLYSFQTKLVTWACRKGRGAVFADCGLGKSPMQLVWAENVARVTGGRVLILTPLSVGPQTVREATKFGIHAERSADGRLPDSQIVIANYQRLHHFNPDDFEGVVLDESSILKSFEGKTRAQITDFMRTRPYRLLCTATAAPNDYTELGTSAEALGRMGFMDMLTRFFKNDRNNASVQRAWASQGGGSVQWRFKGHAEVPFWEWVASWARAVRKPEDIGCSDTGFELPPLNERDHIVQSSKRRDGMLFAMPAVGLAEERAERRATLRERCERAAELVVGTGQPAVLWCHLNDEGNLLANLLPEAVQVAGADSDEVKEERFEAFSSGAVRLLITKPKIGAWGLNWQHCAHMTTFASHSFEQYYQSVRRFWRFGQKRPVTVDHIASDGESGVLKNFRAKAARADKMFEAVIRNMRQADIEDAVAAFNKKETVPQWL